MEFDRVAHLRNQFEELGMATTTQDLIIAPSLKTSRNRNYQSAQKAWVQWAQANNVDPFNASDVDIANYPSERSSKGSAANSIKLYLTAIRELQPKARAGPAILSKVIASTNSQAPPRNLAPEPLDVSPVLATFSKWGPNSALSDYNLRRKLVWLLAITTFSRSSDLHRIDATTLRISKNSLSGSIRGPKERRGGRPIVKPFQ
ncbi:hypothetical protein BGZ88_006831, partial [Linnemannia elongata]